MDNLIGKKLDGRYLLEELVGEGGMANVYRAMDLKEQRTVAVKILKEECTESEEMVRRFKNESKAISILNHPGIVKVYDVSVTDKIQYMVMEYVDGITLKEYLSLRGGPLTWKETLHFITQVLEALSHAHSKGVVHRDVKPQNIMLQSNGQVKLMDFGIARFSQAENYALGDKAIGSVHYISPEQAKGMPTDATTDIYSVGVMMYEMLSGKLPFESNSAVSVAIKQISDEAVPLSKLMPDLPTGLSEICCKAMAKDHRDRYQSAPAMLEAIRQFKQDPSIQFEYKYLGDAAPTPVSRPAARPARQNKKAGSESTMAETGAHKGKAAPKSAPKAAPRKGRKHKNGSYFIPAMAGMAMAFLIGSIVLCYLIFTNSTNALFSNREDVDLVNFVGMSKSDVEGNSDYSKKFSITYVEEYNSNYEEGYIYSQTPKPPRTVKAGQKVTLKVSLGTLWVQVKDVTNMSQDQAVETLREQGLSVVQRLTVDDSVPVGTVIRTEPEAGTSLASGAQVIVYVSKQQVDINRTVPNLIGLSSQEDAVTSLRSANLRIGSVTETYSDLPAGTIVDQSPAAGSKVRMNSGVNVAISIGPEPAASEDQGWWDEDGNYHEPDHSDEDDNSEDDNNENSSDEGDSASSGE